MAQEILQQRLSEAIQLARSGDKSGARAAFVEVLRLDSRNETALIGLVTVASEPKERLAVLRRAFALYPDSPKVAEAMRRLGIRADQLTTTSTPAAPPANVPAAVAPPVAVPTISNPIKPTLKRLTSTSEMQAVVLPPDPEPSAASGVRALTGLRKLTATSDTPPEAPAPSEETVAVLTLAEVIARLNTAPTGDSGVPIPEIGRLQLAAQEAEALVNQFNNQPPQSATAWGKKDKNRAGEADRRIFQTRIAGATTAAVFVVAVLSLVALLGNPDIQKLVFAPTWTVSPTATASATPTPGLTPTPSPTSPVTLTPSPTFPPQFGTADPLVQPRLTEVNAPNGVLIEPQMAQVVALLNQGNGDAARAILTNEKNASELTGNFLPYYYAVQLDVAEGNLREARQELERGEELWQERSNNELFEPMVNVAYALVGLAEQAQGNASESLEAITDRLEASIAFDTEFIAAYLVLADRYLLADDNEAALETLERGLTASPTNVELRTKRAEILIGQRQLDAALQALHEALLLDPYAERALQLQIDIAFLQDDAGLAVIYAEQYMARYPGRVRPIKQRGDAWLLEGKTDLALNEYTRALNGDPEDAAYLEALLARAALYGQLQRFDLAQQDTGAALAISDDPQLRATRMQIAFDAGADDLALADAEQLIALPDTPPSAVLVQSVILLRRGEPSEAIIQALSGVLDTLEGTQRDLAYETLARAYFASEDYANALDRVNTALRGTQTLGRRLLRGQISEAQTANPDLEEEDRTRLWQQALADYRWVQTFSTYSAAVDPDALEEAIARVENELG